MSSAYIVLQEVCICKSMLCLIDKILRVPCISFSCWIINKYDTYFMSRFSLQALFERIGVLLKMWSQQIFLARTFRPPEYPQLYSSFNSQLQRSKQLAHKKYTQFWCESRHICGMLVLQKTSHPDQSSQLTIIMHGDYFMDLSGMGQRTHVCALMMVTACGDKICSHHKTGSIVLYQVHCLFYPISLHR